jgi:hypothetical protein
VLRLVRLAMFLALVLRHISIQGVKKVRLVAVNNK